MSFDSKGDETRTTQAVQFPSFIEQPATRITRRLEQLGGQAPVLSPEAGGLLSGILGGDFLVGGPDFDLLMREAERQILPGVISRFAGSGRGRGGLAGEAAARGLGGAFANLVSGERQRQLQALPFAFRQAEAPFAQQLGILQALLRAPAGQTQTATQTPGRLSTLGQIAQVAAPFASFAFSDRRLKRNIRRIGSIFGLPAYEFEYVWGGPRWIGVIAQDVLKINPDAVITAPNGYLMVDYGRLHG